MSSDIVSRQLLAAVMPRIPSLQHVFTWKNGFPRFVFFVCFFFFEGYYCSGCVRLCLWDWIGRLTPHLRGHVFKGLIWEDNGEITRCGVFYGGRFFFFFTPHLSGRKFCFSSIDNGMLISTVIWHKIDLISPEFFFFFFQKKSCTSHLIRCSFILKGSGAVMANRPLSVARRDFRDADCILAVKQTLRGVA